MDYTIVPMTEQDREPVIDIFNYWVENSYAAFPETPLPYPAFDLFLEMSGGYPTGTIKDVNGRVIGFGMLRRYNPIPGFAHTAEISYFLHPDYTGQGLGRALLEHLETEGRRVGITSILASISSLNPGSIKFHENNGFVERGRFIGIGKKKGRVFDNVWMQKTLD